MKAYMKRHLEAFGLDFVWRGGREIAVEHNGEVLYTLSLDGIGIAFATKKMVEEESNMMRQCVF